MLVTVKVKKMAQNTMDGTEQIIFENTDLGAYSGYVFTDQLQAGDTIVLTAYVWDIEDGKYKVREGKTITGVQANTVLEVREFLAKGGAKVTCMQTAGTYRTINSEWFKR
jgi:hypothetical protein